MDDYSNVAYNNTKVLILTRWH